MMSSEGENERNKNYFPNKQQKCFTGSGVAHTTTWAEKRETLGGRDTGQACGSAVKSGGVESIFEA